MQKKALAISLIIDGKIIKDNLKKINKNIDWLLKDISSKNYSLNDIMLCTYDKKLTYYLDDNSFDYHNN